MSHFSLKLDFSVIVLCDMICYIFEPLYFMPTSMNSFQVAVQFVATMRGTEMSLEPTNSKHEKC